MSQETAHTSNPYKVLMIDDDELIARSTAEYFNILGLKTAYITSCRISGGTLDFAASA